MNEEFEARILAVLHALGPGEVVSYGEVAEEAGLPGRARLVGRLLSSGEHDVSWWRVVNSVGRLVPGHEAEHAERLRAEGVEIRGNRVANALRSPR